MLWCCVSLYLFGMYGTPKLMFLVVANVNNVAIGLTSFHLLWVNTHFLPAELQPKWYQKIPLAGCGFFYLGLAAMVFRVDQWPIIRTYLESMGVM